MTVEINREATLSQRHKKFCSVCKSPDLEVILEMPSLPLTGVFLTELDSTKSAYCFDQGLAVCKVCGHSQLTISLPSNEVYDHTYFHRSSQSPIARQGNDFFEQFIRSVVGGEKFKCILEIGANDLYLINNLKDLSDNLVAVDPIWKVEEPPILPGLGVLGKFIEELSAEDMPAPPDMVISVQTFEHIDEPLEQLTRLVDVAAEEAIFFLEVPGFDALLRNARFDQVFHQHIQYYSLASILKLVEMLGCTYVSHSINNRYWGGALGIAFKKSKNTISAHGETAPLASKITPDIILNRFISFKQQMKELIVQLEDCPLTSIYGFGAAQMVPTLAYHMESDFGFLKGILDDDPKRGGLYYPSLAVKTVTPELDFAMDDSAVFVTAVDSSRRIFSRLVRLNPQQIILPFQVI